jgi:hypothetical protein
VGIAVVTDGEHGDAARTWREPWPLRALLVGLVVGAVAATPAITDSRAPDVPATVAKRERFHAIDHDPSVALEDRQKIDALVDLAVFENSGSDSRQAEEELIALGMKAVPRVVNVFFRVKSGEQTGEGFEDRMGRAKAAIADRILRSIDGYQERVRHVTPIRATSEQHFAAAVAASWIAWWDADGWKHPQKPWDPRIDGER